MSLRFGAALAASAAIAVLIGACSQPEQAPPGADAPAADVETPIIEAPPVQDAVPAGTAESEGRETPPLALIDGPELAALREAADGKPLVVNIWATWCIPCVEEMPYFIEFYEEFSPERAAFLSLSVDDPEVMETTVARFMEDHGLNFPVYVASLETELEDVATALATEIDGVLPTTIFYDRSGEAVHTHTGLLPRDDLFAAVNDLL